jgi:hypothetical protein
MAIFSGNGSLAAGEKIYDFESLAEDPDEAPSALACFL